MALTFKQFRLIEPEKAQSLEAEYRRFDDAPMGGLRFSKITGHPCDIWRADDTSGTFSDPWIWCEKAKGWTA